ncbi:MAG: NifU family protein [Ignavibacteriae bacterium]|nr:NifU family protein [Ignavibacteriota bacterium]
MQEYEVTEISRRIEGALEICRPYLRADAGDVKLLRFKPESGVVEVKWEGTCLICPMSVLTLRAGVERAIMRAVPEVKRVEAVGG